MSSQLYSPLPLDPSIAEIRTLTILPSVNREAPVDCLLNVISLNGDCCDFEALSYVWHEPSLASTPPVAILVNGVEFTPTPNLFSALQHLRLPEKARTVWADAICINQEDGDERNAQVPLMTRIYTRAKAVAVWLGPSNSDIDTYARLEPLVDDNILMLYDQFDSHSMFNDQSTRVGLEILTNLRYLLLKEATMFDRLYRGHRSLIQNKYWTRMWTYQECCLPAAHPTFYCGSHSFSWEQLDSRLVGRSARSLLRLVKALKVRIVPAGGQPQLLKELEDCENNIHRGLAASRGADEIAYGSSALLRKEKRYRRNRLQDTLIDTRRRQCSNPVDRFYALYGTVRGGFKLPQVDYSKSFLTVSGEITAYLITKETGATLFDRWDCTASTQDTLSEPHSAVRPSWVPDFRTTIPPLFPVLDLDVRPSLKNKVLSISQDLSTISVQGKRFSPFKVLARFTESGEDNAKLFADGLSQVLPRLIKRSGNSFVRKRIQRLFATILSYEKPILYYGSAFVGKTLDSPTEALVDRNSQANNMNQPSPANISSNNQPILGENIISLDYISSLRSSTLSSLTEHTVMFVTDDLHLGFANAQMQDGDIVARLGDQTRCCVLRPCEAGSSETALLQTVTMIGPGAVTYLPRIWDTEADPEAPLPDISKAETESVVFIIR